MKFLSDIFSWIISLLFLITHNNPVTMGSTCPSDPAPETRHCLRQYTNQLGTILTSGQTLFSGADVEEVRTLCSNFRNGMKCVENLKSDCPKSFEDRIKSELDSLDVAVDELNMLCSDDSLYDVYARNRYCYESAGKKSELCFENIMNSSVRVVTDFDKSSSTEFCRNVQSLLDCVGNALKDKNCNAEAVRLADKLVRPMVRRSLHCDKSAYKVESSRNTESTNTNGRSSIETKDNNHNASNSLRYDLSIISSIIVTFLRVSTFMS